MKIKKIVSAVLASAVAVGMCAANAFAVEDGQATFCFDTDACIEKFLPYGSVEATNAKLSHTVLESKNGNGSVVVSVNIEENIEDAYGGFYVEAASLGLDSFKNCTVEMSVKACEDQEISSDSLVLYSDGIIYLSSEVPELSSKEWTTISLAIPEGADNNKVGFTIPTFQIRSGDMIYIDDFTITQSDGTVIANQGDYEVKAVASEDAASTGQSIGMTILLVVLILAIVGGIGLIVSSALRKFS